MSSSIPGLREHVLAADTMFGPYRIVRALGTGSFGAVYEALQMPLGKRVALKVMHGHVAAQSDAVHRFHREAQALVRLKHPHVVDVFDLGEIDGRPFIAMEFLDGEPLASRMARVPVMPLAMAADLMVPVCVAVAAAHDLGIVHRDIKPDNIFIARAMGADHPKLLDFGIAKLAVPDGSFAGTATSTLLGTPYYMAPEQVRSTRDVTPHADQWALGVILWEALTGRKPFNGDSLFDVLQQVIAMPLPALLSLRPDLPPQVAVAIQQTLSREPDQRLPSVRHLGLALLAIASDRTRATFTGPLQPPLDAASGVPSTVEFVHPVSFPAPVSTERATSIELPARPSKTARSPGAPARWAVAVAATVATAALLGVGVSALTRPDAPPATSAPAPRAAAAPALVPVRPVAPPAAAPRPRLLVSVESVPATATLVLDGVTVGTGRAHLEVPADLPHQLRVQAPGYAPQTVAFRDVAPPTRIQLEPLAPPVVAAPVVAAPARPSSRDRRAGHHRAGSEAAAFGSSYPTAPAVSAPAPAPAPASAPAPSNHRSGGLNSSEF